MNASTVAVAVGDDGTAVAIIDTGGGYWIADRDAYAASRGMTDRPVPDGAIPVTFDPVAVLDRARGYDTEAGDR